MIVTITPNTGLDRVLFVRDFKMGKTVRAHASAWGMGGKATDASMVLGALGETNLATGFAAGDTGHRMIEMLQTHAHTRCRFVWTGGETRTNYVLIDTIGKAQSTITVSGLHVDIHHISELERLLEQHLAAAGCIIMGGSMPQGAPVDLYARLIRQARKAGKPVILDASGEALKAGVGALPSIIKPNLDEMEMLAGRRLRDEKAILVAARQLVATGIEMVVATIGASGLWAVTANETVFAHALPITAVNTAGAGDALVAGISVGIARGWPWRRGLGLGIAAAAAVCLTPGTAICKASDVDRLLPQVEIEERARDAAS